MTHAGDDAERSGSEASSSVPPWPSAGGGYPPPPYPYPPPPPYPPAPKNGLGTASLAVAVAGLVTALSVIGGVVLGVVAVVLGFLGYRRVRRKEADHGGVAIAGIVLGSLAILAGIACIFIYVDIWKTAGGGDYIDCMTKAGTDSALQQQCADRFRENFENKFSGTPAPAAPAP